MTNISLKKSDASIVYQKASGAGTDADPHVPHHNVDVLAAGGSVDLGAKNDTEATTNTGSFSLIALIKRALNTGQAIQGKTTAIVVAVVTQAAAFHANDLLAAKITLASAVRVSGGTGIIQSIVLADKAAQNAAIDIVFFNADPSATTFTLNSALTLADADLLKGIGHVSIAASDYISFADNSQATKSGLGLAFAAVGSTSLYAALVTRGTPTYATTGDLQLTVTILQD